MQAELTPELYDLVCKINLEINDYQYTPDQEVHNKPDHWEDIRVKGEGDCDDYAVGKLRALITAGIPEKACGICTCWTETGDYHAVLALSTTKGDFILDNRKPWPTPFELCGYKWDYVPEYLRMDG